MLKCHAVCKNATQWAWTSRCHGSRSSPPSRGFHHKLSTFVCLSARMAQGLTPTPLSVQSAMQHCGRVRDQHGDIRRHYASEVRLKKKNIKPNTASDVCGLQTASRTRAIIWPKVSVCLRDKPFHSVAISNILELFTCFGQNTDCARTCDQPFYAYRGFEPVTALTHCCFGNLISNFLRQQTLFIRYSQGHTFLAKSLQPFAHIPSL